MQPVEGSATARMQGAIEAFDAATGTGVIAGPGGVRYRFEVDSLAQSLVPAVWQRVEFSTAGDGRAVGIDLPRAHARIDLGRVVQQAFGALRGNWPIFLASAVILAGIPSAFGLWGGQAMLTRASRAAVLAYALGTTGNFLGHYLLTGVALTATMNSFQGKPTTLGETLDATLRTALPLLGLGIVITLSTFVASLLLVIPGLIVSVWWSVASAVLVEERRGVLASLHRSKDLTEGSGWQIFGLLVVIGVASFGLSWAARTAIATLAEGWPREMWTAATVAVQAAINVVVRLASVVVTISLYHELRRAKEGEGSHRLAAVFD